MVVVETSPGYRPYLHFNEDVEAFFIRTFGVDHFQAICQALTCPSRFACLRVNTLHTTCQEVLSNIIEILRDYHAAFISKAGLGNQDQLCNGMLAFGLDGALKGHLCFEHPRLKDTIIVQGDGPRQIDYTGNHGIMKEVVVSRKCAEAVLRGANVFVPGVLACSGHVEEGDIVAISVAIEHVDEKGDWVVGVTRGTVLQSEHGNAQFREKAQVRCYIGKGRSLLSRAGMFRELHGVAVEMVDRVYNLPSLHGILTGKIFLQNLPSIVAARVLDPQPGDNILDMCAAPGGKTTAMAILMKDKGTIAAIDRSHNKVMDIRRLTEEMKITCVHAYKVDALKAVKAEENQLSCLTAECLVKQGTFERMSEEVLPVCKADVSSGLDNSREGSSAATCMPEVLKALPNGKSMQYPSNAKARKEGRRLRNGSKQGQNPHSHDGLNHVIRFERQSFDKVLLDPPCSALGLRPRLFAGEETIEGLRRHASYQKRLFDQAVQLCRPGGVIVYSTCTINPGENEAVVRYVLDTYPFVSLVHQSPHLGGPGLTGTVDDGVSCKELLKEEEKHLVQRFDPSAPLDTIGFFIAKFQVKAS